MRQKKARLIVDGKVVATETRPFKLKEKLVTVIIKKGESEEWRLNFREDGVEIEHEIEEHGSSIAFLPLGFLKEAIYGLGYHEIKKRK